MSIKGTSQELYVGKKESNILTFFGNTKKLVYDDLKRIDFSYASTIEPGYVKFIDNDNKVTRFEFSKKTNDKIEKTIELIEGNNPQLNIVEHSTEELKFYQSWWFTLLMMFCCCYPVGLFLMWYNKKFCHGVRVAISIVFTVLFIIWAYKYYITMNNISNAMKSLQDSLNGIY